MCGLCRLTLEGCVLTSAMVAQLAGYAKGSLELGIAA
jgi:hypothetical protein